MSQHAGCPVLAGQKWAANMWVWNGCRYGLDCNIPPNQGLAQYPEYFQQLYSPQNEKNDGHVGKKKKKKKKRRKRKHITHDDL
jgi:hypothetical protein